MEINQSKDKFLQEKTKMLKTSICENCQASFVPEKKKQLYCQKCLEKIMKKEQEYQLLLKRRTQEQHGHK